MNGLLDAAPLDAAVNDRSIAPMNDAALASAGTSLVPAQSAGVISQFGFDYSQLDREVADDARGTADKIRTRMTGSNLDTGRDLARIKARLPHGQFGVWIKREFDMSKRTAQRYMRSAELADKDDIVSLLPTAIVNLIAAPSAPEPVVQEVLADARSGQIQTPDQVKTKIADAIDADRRAKIDAAKTPEKRKREEAARRGRATRSAREAEQREQREARDEQERVERLSLLVQRIAATIEPVDLIALNTALRDWRDKGTLVRLLAEAADRVSQPGDQPQQVSS